jgi:SAM-dependent methyltransferase
MSAKSHCPVCSGNQLHTFLVRENEPVHQNFVMMTQQSAREITRDILTLACCENCGFIFNTTFEPEKIQYGACYDNTQICSPEFNEYHTRLVKDLVHKKHIDNQRVVEVGCGKGHFIREIIRESGFRNTGFGFDPSYTGPETDLDGRLTFVKKHYGPEYRSIQADAVVCRHVIEHVPEPLVLLDAIRGALAGSSQAKVFFETPCVEWILQNNVIWDFFYEHCSYFSPESLRTTFELSGFSVDSIEHTFGGQYLWLEGTLAPEKSITVRKNDISLRLSAEFGRNYATIRQKYAVWIGSLRSEGNLALWGAGAKGVTMANIIDPECESISCIIDINPKKQGHYIPGTGHPIIDYHQIPQFDLKNIIVMNPNYYDETKQLLQEAGIEVRLRALK